MPDGPAIGTAYLRVAGDFSQVQAQAVGLFSSNRWGKMGKAAGAALAGGLAVGGALKGLYEIGQAFDDVEDTLRVKTGASGKHLKRLEGDVKSVVKNVPVDLKTAGDAVAELNQRLGLTGKPLRQMTKQMTALSKITDTDVTTNIEAVSKAFVDWEVKTKDQSATLDGFFRISQKSGLAVDEIASAVQRFGSPLRQLGFSLEESAAMFANFERAGVNTQTMVPGLKLAISNLTRPTEDLGASMNKLGISVGKPDKALREVFALMSEKGLSTVEKTGLAMDVFGKRAGADMAEAIRQGRFEVGDLMKVMEKGGKTIRGTEERTRDFDESLQLLKNNLMVALEPAARNVFDEIGKIAEDISDIVGDKDLNVDQKIDQIADVLGDAVERNGPKIAEAGGKIGLELLKGTFHAFMSSDLLGKAFIGAGALKLFGGTSALGSLGGRLGSTIGQRAAQSMSTTIGGLNVFGGNEARSAGQSFGLVFGTAAAVAAAGNMIEGADAFTEFWEGAKPKLAVHFMEQWAGRVDEITSKQRDAFKQQVRAMEASGEITHKVAKGILGDIRDVEREMRSADEAQGRGAGIGFAQRIAADRKATGKEIDDILREIKRLPKGAQEEAANTMIGMAKKMEEKSRLPEGSARKLRKDVTDEFEDMKVKSVRESTKLVTGMAGNFSSLLSAVTTGLNALGGGTEKALKQFGVKDWKYIAVKAGQGLLGAMGFAEGGFHGVLPGYSTVDDRLIAVRGGEAVLRPEDHIPRVDRALRRDGEPGGLRGMFKRSGAKVPGYASGGTVASHLKFALGPETIPPIQYDANHAGGNSHVHIAMDSVSAAQAVAREIAGMGWQASEAPWAGGVAPIHQDPGHYTGSSFDANTGADETHPEVAALAKFLGGGSAVGAGGTAAAVKLAKILLKGPKGPGLDAGQGSVDLAWKAAQAFVDKNQPTDDGNVGSTFSGGGSAAQNRALGHRMLTETPGQYGSMRWGPWGESEWPPYDRLIQSESNWSTTATNPSSGAYGIPQSLPPEKMAAAGADWKTNPATQIAWGLDYIKEVYGAPSNTPLGGYGKGGLVEDIRGLYDDLGDLGGKSKKGKGNKAGKAASDINQKIKKLTARLNRRRNRSEKKKLAGLKNPFVANSVSLSLTNWANTFTEKANVTEDQIARLETKHGGTVAPESLEDAMSMLGLTLGSNQEWEGLDPTTQQTITGLLGTEFGREQEELNLEISKNEELLGYLVSQRNSVLAGLKEAKKQLRDVAEQIEDAKRKRERAEKDARRIDKEADRLDDQAKKAKGQRKRQLEARAREKRFNARQRHADAAFEARRIEALTGRRETLIEGRDTYQDSLDEVQGIGSPTDGVITALPPLTAGGVPLYGGRLLDVQDHLRELGSTKIVKPDFASEDAGTDTSESGELWKQLYLDEAARNRLRNVDHSVIDQFFADARLPRFHEGGVFHSPAGGEGPAMLRDREVILTPEQASAMGGPAAPVVYVVVEDGAVDAGRIKVLAADEVRDREEQLRRKATRVRAPIGRR